MEGNVHSSYLNAIKSFAGFASRASWDSAQHEIAKAAEIVDRVAPGLDSGTRAALTSLTFNAGTKWINDGLGQVVREGSLDDAQHIFLQYTKAGGEDLPGLVKRRLEEATWFGTGLTPDASSGSPSLSSTVTNRAEVCSYPGSETAPAHVALALLDGVTFVALSLLNRPGADRRRASA